MATNSSFRARWADRARAPVDAASLAALRVAFGLVLFIAIARFFAHGWIHSYFIAPQPMDLLFTTFELVAIGLSVLSIAFIAHDGETNWMEGVQLLAVYMILSLGFFFLPG